jgi:2-keto-4-pentenoate hydratase
MNVWEDQRVVRGMTAQLAERRRRVAAGEQPLGWKLGFGAPAALAKLKIAAPLSGFLMQRGLLVSGATVDVKGWAQPVAEPEIAVRLAADVAPGSSAAVARAAIASLKPAIEIADMNVTATEESLEAVVAGNIYQRHVVLSGSERQGGDTAGLSSQVFRRGKRAAETGDPEALTGKLPDLLAHLAQLLDAFGERLQAGDLVICGSTVPPPLIEPDETEFTHRVAPIGDASVHFAR